MARRDNQGIQIALIVFILTTLLFALATYFGYASSTSLQAKLDQANTDLGTATNRADTAVRTTTSFKEKIGLDGAADDNSALAQVDQWLGSYGQGLTDENKTLVSIIENLNTRVTSLNTDLASANRDNQRLRRDMEDAIAAEQKKLEVARTNENKAHEDFQTKLTEYQQLDQRSKQAIADQAAEANKAVADRNQKVTAAQNEVAAAKQQEDIARRLVDVRTEELNKIRNDIPDAYDGNVVGVDARTKTVLIDLGRADGLRPKMTFSVFDAEFTNVRSARKKATIEITRVVSDHSAQARITDANETDPIIRNDYIYSPIWSPGETLGIALIGEFDLDRDGLDDRDYIRNLIAMNGGRIDAEETRDENGQTKRSGKIDVNTRYLIVGDGQIDASGLMEDANTYAVEKMSTSELLDLMSSPGRARTIRYDGVARPGDFSPEEQINGKRNTAERFRPRSPLTRRNRLPK